MQIKWSQAALRDQEKMLDWYADFSLKASDRMYDRIIGHVRLMARFPRLGHVVAPGRYHLPIPGTPFILAYRIDEIITIVRLHHKAQDWPGRF